MENDKRKKLETILALDTLRKLSDKALNKEDFFRAFKSLHETFQKLGTALLKKVDEEITRLQGVESKLTKEISEVKRLVDTKHKDIEKTALDTIDKAAADIRTDLTEFLTEELVTGLATIPKSEEVAKEAAKLIPAPDFEDIEKEIKAITKEVKSIPRGRIGGAKGFTLMVDGQKKLLTAQTLNIVAGSGVAVSYNYANGRNDVTISVSSTGLSVLTVTGTVDDSNTSFTVASEPTLVVINGASYRSTGGAITWSYAAGTLTLSSAIGSGSDIYALG